MPNTTTRYSNGEVERVRIPPIGLDGFLALPEQVVGLVLFAHGSGSGRRSPRNNAVAADLRTAGLGTLLFDLLTEQEALDRHNVFDIALLAQRLDVAASWALELPQVADLPIGFFGASTGAAAALVAEANADFEVNALVSRGGRPDLAGESLKRVRAPTLLIVGGDDEQVIALNEQALAELQCEKQLVIVPGATHLFEELGALERVTDLARRWFLDHMAQEERSEGR